MITGSTASSLQGEPRSTHDIDLVIALHKNTVDQFHKAIQSPEFYLDLDTINEAINNQSMFNLIDTTDGNKVDFRVLTNDSFDKSRFTRIYIENVFGFDFHVSTPEDTILAKLKWTKLSFGSQKQFTDALRVYEVQFKGLDQKYLTDWSKVLEVKDLLIS